MKKLTILPAIDLRGGKCVRLIKGDYKREIIYSDNPVEQALEWQNSGAEYIHIVDLDGAKGGSVENLRAIEDITGSVSVPCELGGGIRTMETAEKILDAGISRVILGTAACKNRDLVVDMIEHFGAGKIVVGIDAKDGKAAIDGWLEDSGIDALELAEYFAEKGVERFIYTDISTDGMLTGPNLQAQKSLCDRVPSAKIIASGGIAKPEDVRDLMRLDKDNLEGVIIGKALYDKKATLQEFIRAALPEGA